MNTGIERISFYTPRYYLDLKTLAAHRGVDPDKFTIGLRQERMAVPPPDEDIVTMAASACRQALEGIDPSTLDTLMFATESGIDQSKAAAIYVHRLLGLPSTCKAVELKQACCSSTAGLQMALAMVARKPAKRILLVASDIARYGLGAAGEPTQGAGAVAMVISAQPSVIAFEPECGAYTEDVMDFWRPNYMDEALVDGKYSIKIYLKALDESWKDYTRESNRGLKDFAHFCYHLPFTRMAEKAHLHLAKISQSPLSAEELMAQVETSLAYNRVTGNCYTGSLYEGLLALLENSPGDLTGDRVGLFSYGSGCMGAFFGGIVQPGYREALAANRTQEFLAKREEITYPQYEQFYTHRLPTDGSFYETTRHLTGPFRLAGVRDHKRLYESTALLPAHPGPPYAHKGNGPDAGRVPHPPAPASRRLASPRRCRPRERGARTALQVHRVQASRGQSAHAPRVPSPRSPAR